MSPTNVETVDLEEHLGIYSTIRKSTSSPPFSYFVPFASLPRDTAPSPPAASNPHPEQPQPQHPTHSATMQEAEDSFLHPADKLWSLYLKDADTEDKHLVESWKGDTDGILIFTGLFAATVATFVTQTYQLLVPPPDDPSAAILLQVSRQLAGLPNGTSVPAYAAPPSQLPFQPPFYAVWINTLWFLSLFLSLTGALMATLMQQWTRRYLRGIQYRSAPHIRGPMRLELRLGVKKYKMKQMLGLITGILHAAVFIFFAGLVGFAFSLNSTVANVLTTFVSVLLAVYIFLSVLPTFSTIAPYDTALTPALQVLPRLGRIIYTRTVKLTLKVLHTRSWHWLFSPYTRWRLIRRIEDIEEYRFLPREQDLMHITRVDDYLTGPRLPFILDRILTNTDEHDEVENFLDSMTILLPDTRSDYPSLLYGSSRKILFGQHLLGDKIRSLVCSCQSHRDEVPLSARIKRLRTVVKFIRHEDIREAARLSEYSVKPSSEYKYALSKLAGDRNSSISFLSQLIIICSCMEANVSGKIQHYSLRNSAAACDYYREGISIVAWPLFCFVELVCVILKFAASDSAAEDPVATYYHLWEPILSNAQRYAIKFLETTLREGARRIAEPIPRELLFEAGLGDFVHTSHLPPARRPPTDKERRKIERIFSMYPILAKALRDVVEATPPPLLPLWSLPSAESLHSEISSPAC